VPQQFFEALLYRRDILILEGKQSRAKVSARLVGLFSAKVHIDKFLELSVHVLTSTMMTTGLGFAPTMSAGDQ